MKRRTCFGLAALPAVAGCTLGGHAAIELAFYDHGIDSPPGAGTRLARSLALDEVSAGSRLQTQAILYRLSYRDPAQLFAYGRSQWTEPPPALLTRRLRAALAASNERGVTMVSDAVKSDQLLKADLEAFEQNVVTPASGQALVRLHVSLIEGGSRTLRAQRAFGHSVGGAAVTLGVTRGLRTRRLITLAAPASLRRASLRVAAMLGLSPRVAQAMLQAAAMSNGRSLDDLESTGLSLPADVSALLLHDPRDRQVPISESAIVAAAWPNARLHQIAGVGHNGILAADSVHRLLLDFIAPPVRTRTDLAMAS